MFSLILYLIYPVEHYILHLAVLGFMVEIPTAFLLKKYWRELV